MQALHCRVQGWKIKPDYLLGSALFSDKQSLCLFVVQPVILQACNNTQAGQASICRRPCPTALSRCARSTSGA